MKKINLLTALFVTLLVCGNLWAQNTCKIGTTEYSSLVDAIAAVPANDVPTTIQMIADENAGDIGSSFKYVIPANKNIKLDLNGKTISGTTSDAATMHIGLFQVQANGTLTILDGQNPDCDTTKTLGCIDYKSSVKYTGNTGRSTIYVYGTLNVEGGKIMYSTLFANADGAANYTLDLFAGAVCTIQNGYIWSSVECIRTFASATPIIINILGGYMYGYWGLIFAMDPSGGTSGYQTINISGGKFVSDNYPLIRIYTTGKDNLQQTNINISGGECNQDALMINHTYGTTYAGTVAELDSTLRTQYPNVFNITGGTYKSDNYEIRTYGVLNAQGELNPDADSHVYASTLPTLLDGAAFKVDSLDVNKYGIVPVVNNNITDASQLDDPDEAATIAQNIVIGDGTAVVKDSAYNITVKDNSTLTIKANAELFVGAGGITIEEGSKVIVEAGAVLKVGANGVVGTGADALVVYSNMEASGVVAISPMAYLNQSPKLSINLNVKAWSESSTVYKWQYFGIPTKGDCHLDWGSFDTYMKKWDAENQQWENVATTAEFDKPFVGYLINPDVTSQGALYTMSGEMVGRDDASLILQPGWNFFANSYLSPIDLAKLFDCIKLGGDDQIERAITIYDTNDGKEGVYKVVNKLALSSGSCPFKAIPPMNAFFINNRNSGVTGFTIDYSECVWGKEDTKPMLAPSRAQASVSNIEIAIKSLNTADYISLFESLDFSPAYDADADALKYMNAGANIYATVDEQNLAIVATNNLNGQYMSFQAGEDVEYTMSFNGTNGNYLLIDTENGNAIQMKQGTIYTFTATPNSIIENRFQIAKVGVVTDLQKLEVVPAAKGIYTIMGQFIANAEDFVALPAGVYVINGVKVVK